MSDSTTVWLARARAGDEQALGGLLTRQVARLRSFVSQRLSHGMRRRETSQDLVQSVLREVVRDFPRAEFSDARSFRAWLYVAADRKVKGRGRFWGRARRQAASEAALGGRDAELSALAGRDPSPSHEAMLREELEHLARAFACLPPDWREVILLSRVRGCTHAEIAQRLGRTESATRTLLSRALARLSTELEGGAAG